jgi:alpha-glucosidase
MAEPVSRRDVLKRLGATSAAMFVGGGGSQGVFRGLYTDIIVAGRPVEIAVAAASRFTVRVTVQPTANASAPLPFDGALADGDEGKQLARHSSDPFPPVKAGDLRVSFTSSPPTLHFETKNGDPVQQLRLDEKSGDVSFLLPKGPLYGLGQGGPQFDRKGSVDRMRNGQGGYQLDTHGARVPIQWLVGSDGWAMFIHQPAGTFDFSGTEGRFTPADAGAALDVFVVASRDPAMIMAEYARITGKPELPALWTFGYFQSHRTLAGPEEIRGIAQTLREKKLPCDALIYLGTEFTPSGWNTRNGEFDWNPTNFPDPKAAIDELHALNFKVVLHAVIEGKQLTGTVNDACAAPEPSGRTVDNHWPPERHVGCYWPYHKPAMDLGIDGWWPDQGDGLDALSRLARIRMYWDGPQLYRPDERPFALHRNGAPGMQRYGAFLWSGDVESRWETLQLHVPIGLNAGLSGIPYWGTDIGGFVPTQEYTGELFVRWFQFGAFCPLFRSHGRDWHLHLPWGWNAGSIGPIETPRYAPDPAELHNEAVEPICRKYLELRYRMLPYIYTAVRDGVDTGLPIMRALWLHYPDDAIARARGDEYLWGRDLLVAPVTEKGATTKKIYLPRGQWFDYWTEQPVEGGREVSSDVDLETMPLYARAGTILPLAPVKQHSAEPTEAAMTIVVYPGSDGSYTLYEDDGQSFDYRKGEWMRTELTWRDSARKLSLRLAKGSKMLSPARRAIEVRVAGEKKVRSVVFEGKALEVKV